MPEKVHVVGGRLEKDGFEQLFQKLFLRLTFGGLVLTYKYNRLNHINPNLNVLPTSLSSGPKVETTTALLVV